MTNENETKLVDALSRFVKVLENFQDHPTKIRVELTVKTDGVHITHRQA